MFLPEEVNLETFTERLFNIKARVLLQRLIQPYIKAKSVQEHLQKAVRTS